MKLLQLAIRRLSKSSVVALGAIVAVALGIGANTAVATVLFGTLLKPLPVSAPENVVTIYTSDHSGPPFGLNSYPDFADMAGMTETFRAVVCAANIETTVEYDRTRDQGWAQIVSGNYFATLQVVPAAGRLFDDGADRQNSASVAVLSHTAWERRFAKDPSVIGKSVRLNGANVTIVGVAAKDFVGTNFEIVPELWVPMWMQPLVSSQKDLLSQRDSRWLMVNARLKPGTSIERARTALGLLAKQLYGAHAAEWEDARGRARKLSVLPLSESTFDPSIREDLTTLLAVVAVMVFVVLLIACANVTNLLLFWSGARRREMAVRVALGSSRRQLVRDFLVDTFVLTLLGTLLGVGLAHVALTSLVQSIPKLPVPIALDFRLDARVLAFTAALSVITTVLVGLWPALRQSRSSVVEALKDGQVLSGGRPSRSHNAFVIAQLAMAYVLLLSAGLFMMTVRAVNTVDLGFHSSAVVLASIDAVKQVGPARAPAFYTELLERLRAVPGVKSVALGQSVPLDLIGFPRRRITPVGYQPRRGEDLEIHYNVVSPGYLATMGIPLVQGRDLSDRDRDGAPAVAVVTEAMARRFWPNENPLGKEFRIAARPKNVIQVVGVVRNLKLTSFRDSALPAFFLPYEQEEPRPLTVHITSADPAGLPAIVRNEVAALGATAAALDVRTIESHLGAAMFPARAAAAMIGILGLAALALALVGVYGLVGSSVRSRTREIGIRMALGASPQQLMTAMLWRWLVPSTLGIVIGAAMALSLSGMMSSVLFGVSALYLPLYAGTAVELLCVAAFTIYVPVRRASGVAPVIALRS